MPEEKDAPEPAPLPPADETARPLTDAQARGTTSLNRAAATRATDGHRALDSLLETKSPTSRKLLEDLDRQRRSLEATSPPSWLTAAMEAERAAKLQAAYMDTVSLGPTISHALAALKESVLAPNSILSQEWLSAISPVNAALVRSAIPTSLFDHRLEQQFALEFRQLSEPALGLARVLEGAERRQRELEAMLTMPRAAHDAWDAVVRLNEAAARTWDFLGTHPDRLALISPRVAGAPVIEVYAATHAAALVSAPDAAEAEPIEVVPDLESALDAIGDGFEARLAKLDPTLVVMYQGGVERVERGGTDWARQALTSFRELTTHTLHLLAPDAEVKPWARRDHFDNEKLTRRARLEYIVREVDSGDLADFLKIDIQSMLALFNLMHTVHKKSPALDQRQLRILYNRIRGAIIELLDAAGR
jgi:hypothetical protein